MSKVSIGLPVFNGADYVSLAIESILSQSFGDFNLCISDNASSDGTEDICQSFAGRDRRIHYIRQARNVGAAANYNLLFARSDGIYFKWAAHDDVLHPRFLEVSVTALNNQPRFVLASPASQLIDERGDVLPFSAERGGVVDRSGVCWPSLPEENNGLTCDDAALRFEAVLLKMVMCVEVFGLMRREALMQTSLHGPFGGADKVLLAQMALLGPFWLGPEVLFSRRCHPKQFSAISSGAYRTTWFSGRRESLLKQQLKLLVAYCQTVGTCDLSPWQKANCIVTIARRGLFRGNHLERLANGLVGNP